MYPILYEQITAGQVPQHNGLGVLSDAIDGYIERERNSIDELTMIYPADGIHAEELGLRRLIKAKPNFTDAPQLYRIDRIGKTINNRFTVYAKHVSYDLSGYIISQGSANNAASACLLLEQAAPGYTITTDKQVTANFVIKEPGSVRSYFAGRSGSFLDVFGTAELKYNNFDVRFLTHAGEDRGVTIRYGKNLLELSQEINANNLYTHVMAFYRTQDEGIISGAEVSTGLTLDVKKVFLYDASQDYEETPTAEELTDKATEYIGSHNLTTPTNNITLDFIQSGELANRVDLCDTVSIYYEALGIIRASVKCIRTKFDFLREKYIETEFGDVKANLADTISSSKATANEAKATADTATIEVKSKKRVFIATPVPPYDVGDLWTNSDDIYFCATARSSGEDFNPEDWELATNYMDRSAMNEAIQQATDIITGSAGGYIVWHDGDGDGHPDEVLAMNTTDITTATEVVRLNKNGLGLSTTGYNGQFFTAMTARGFVADAITTGNLDAARVTIQHLTASMIHGGKLTLGGLDNQSGTFELLNDQGIVIGEMDKTGLKFYGEGAIGQRPYVLLNNEVGFAGFDANNTKLFWVSRDEFHMRKCVAEYEISACNKLRAIPVTLTDSNDNIINDGVAIVALI